MRNTLAFTVSVCLFSVSAVTWTAAQQPQPHPATAPIAPPATIEEVLTAVRTDLQSERSDIIAKNVTLTSEQAAKFSAGLQCVSEGTGRHHGRTDEGHPAVQVLKVGLCRASTSSTTPARSR